MCEVVIPYANALAEMIPPVAVRLRRDFKTMLTLIRAHALLHQTNRQRDANACFIAEIADYAAVRDLIAEIVAESAEVAIKPEVRETVRAVADLLADGREEVKQTDIKKVLKLDKSVARHNPWAAMDDPEGTCDRRRSVRTRDDTDDGIVPGSIRDRAMRAVLSRGPQGEDKERTRASKAYWTALKRQRETERASHRRVRPLWLLDGGTPIKVAPRWPDNRNAGGCLPNLPASTGRSRTCSARLET
jgi:hypothetical protein